MIARYWYCIMGTKTDTSTILFFLRKKYKKCLIFSYSKSVQKMFPYFIINFQTKLCPHHKRKCLNSQKLREKSDVFSVTLILHLRCSKKNPIHWKCAHRLLNVYISIGVIFIDIDVQIRCSQFNLGNINLQKRLRRKLIVGPSGFHGIT